MKIGFFGTPLLAAFCLEKLMSEHEVVFVVTAEDKPAGRHRRIHFGPVKKIAIQNDIPLYQPEDLLESHFLHEIKSKEAEVFVIVAYGKIVPKEIFLMPPLKTINLHPSILPRYRGAAPIQWALINGENETGVTVQFINEKLDAGDILIQKSLPIEINISAGDLYNIILPIGAELINESLKLLEAGKAVPCAQNENDATYCGKIDRETAHINWERNSLDIHNLVRGLNPKPVTWSTFRGKNMKIRETGLINEEIDTQIKPGYLKIHQKKRLLVGTGDGCIELFQIQQETKKNMDGASFINGYRLRDGDSFDD